MKADYHSFLHTQGLGIHRGGMGHPIKNKQSPLAEQAAKAQTVSPIESSPKGVPSCVITISRSKISAPATSQREFEKNLRKLRKEVKNTLSECMKPKASPQISINPIANQQKVEISVQNCVEQLESKMQSESRSAAEASVSQQEEGFSLEGSMSESLRTLLTQLKEQLVALRGENEIKEQSELEVEPAVAEPLESQEKAMEMSIIRVDEDHEWVFPYFDLEKGYNFDSDGET